MQTDALSLRLPSLFIIIVAAVDDDNDDDDFDDREYRRAFGCGVRAVAVTTEIQTGWN